MAARSPNMCIRCKAIEAPHPLGLCASCVVQTRVEVSAGFKCLGEYLSSWAAFDRWLDERGGKQT
jgi:hypothetical protein